jgi:hypothetical protein
VPLIAYVPASAASALRLRFVQITLHQGIRVNIGKVICLCTRIIAVAATLCCSPANATLVSPGERDIPIHDVAFELAIVDEKSRPFRLDQGQLEGVVTDLVELVNGSYAFETRVVITKAPQGFLVDRVLRTDYGYFTTDARPEPDRLGVQFPLTASRSILPGSTLQFNFLTDESDQRIPVGAAGSSFFAILTDATAYAEVGQLWLGSGDQPLFGPITVFSPIDSPVPEPAQATLLLAGVALLIAISRSRSRLA